MMKIDSRENIKSAPLARMHDGLNIELPLWAFLWIIFLGKGNIFRGCESHVHQFHKVARFLFDYFSKITAS